MNDEEDFVGATDRLKSRYEAIKNVKDHASNYSNYEKSANENLAVTDLFVEYDISFLTERADQHKRVGTILYFLGLGVFSLGAIIAFLHVFGHINPGGLGGLKSGDCVGMIQAIIKSFTAYGLLVLTGVTLWKQSKAKLDQSERIYEKRRANRILRLYIHLKKGEIDIDEMEKILEWGTVNSNAFTSIQVAAQAPMGAALSDLLKNNNELIRTLKAK